MYNLHIQGTRGAPMPLKMPVTRRQSHAEKAAQEATGAPHEATSSAPQAPAPATETATLASADASNVVSLRASSLQGHGAFSKSHFNIYFDFIIYPASCFTGLSRSHDDSYMYTWSEILQYV